jgi:hypothetical protein
LRLRKEAISRSLWKTTILQIDEVLTQNGLSQTIIS